MENNIVTDILSRIPLNGNQETTQKSIYQQEIASETNDIEELPEGTFPINARSYFMDHHQFMAQFFIVQLNVFTTISLDSIR